ncbi:MAG: hypothetical protein V2B19_03510 [Pseudomonadota bacterium]
MDQLQKKFIIISLTLFLFTIGCALLIKSGGHLDLLPIFYHLFSRYDLPGSILSILVLSAAIVIAFKIENAPFDRFIISMGNYPLRLAWLVVTLLGFGAFFIYQKFPLTADEYMPCMQARIFAEGKLWGQYPPRLVPWLLLPDYFTVFSPETGRFISDYWPGFALLLTPFMKAGAPWLLNPLVSGGTLALLWYYTKKVLPESAEAPGWVLLLTIASPVFAANGISFYSMSAHLFFNLIYAALLLKLSYARLFAAGLVGSFALVLHHPVPHLLFALPWIFWIGRQKGGISKLGILFAGYLPLSLWLGFGWVYLKLLIVKGNSPGSIGQEAGALSAIPSQLQDPSFSGNIVIIMLKKALTLIANYVTFPTPDLLWARLIASLKIFVWAIPGLPILAFLGVSHIRGNDHLQLWGWSALFTFAGYLFIPFSQGHGWGFRYFHSAWLWLPLLAAAFLTSNPANGKIWKRLIVTTAILCIIFGISLRCYQIHQFISGHLSQGPRLTDGKKRICFFNTYYGYFLFDFVRNDPFLRNRIINLQSLGFKKDREMMAQFFPGAKEISRSVSVTIWELPDERGN